MICGTPLHGADNLQRMISKLKAFGIKNMKSMSEGFCESEEKYVGLSNRQFDTDNWLC